MWWRFTLSSISHGDQLLIFRPLMSPNTFDKWFKSHRQYDYTTLFYKKSNIFQTRKEISAVKWNWQTPCRPKSVISLSGTQAAREPSVLPKVFVGWCHFLQQVGDVVRHIRHLGTLTAVSGTMEIFYNKRCEKWFGRSTPTTWRGRRGQWGVTRNS